MTHVQFARFPIISILATLFMIYWRCLCCFKHSRKNSREKKMKCSPRICVLMCPLYARYAHNKFHASSIFIIIIIRWSFLIAHTFEITRVRCCRVPESRHGCKSPDYSSSVSGWLDAACHNEMRSNSWLSIFACVKKTLAKVEQCQW